MGLEFHHISHAYGPVAALQDVSFIAEQGQITCLLGPSGCGKTTLLRIAAGLLPLQQGEIHLDGALLAKPGQDPAPEDRPVGLVFQEGALFPHLTVADNIGFGVRDKALRIGRVTHLLDQIGLAGFEGRYPHTLSGGQQQRVALARALAPSPRVLLLDEPFANIDIQRRRALREETRRVLKRDGGIVLLVTHDPDEALEMADQIAVLEAGRLVQAGPPQALYDRPATLGVATLIGDARTVPAQMTDEGLKTPFGIWPLSCLANGAESQTELQGDLALAVRPSALTVAEEDSGCAITDIRSLGGALWITVEAPSGDALLVHQTADLSLAPGNQVRVVPRDGSVFGFPASD